MPTCHKVLIADDNLSPQGLDLLRQSTDLIQLPAYSTEDQLREAARDVDGILLRACNLTAPIIEAAARLQIVSRHGVGYDNVDVEACTRRGIVVSITESANAQAVSEHAFACMLALANRIVAANASMRQGKWDRAGLVGLELGGKVLGIFGLGRIGSKVAKQARAFDMEVITCDPYIGEDRASQFGAELVEAATLLERADFITVHVPLSPETRHLIGASELERMKSTAYLVNTARGGIVDEAAICAALDSGSIAGAALDVFEEEPVPPNHPLFQLDNLLLCSPHVSGQTAESMVRMSVDAAENILRVLRGEPPSFAVNPEVLKDRSRVAWRGEY
jgi:D-3-phosphoglycerate dehydrogenase